MSFLDIDERLVELADKIEVVYSPYVDLKEFPEDVDVTLVEGAVSSVEDLHKIKDMRAKTKVLVAFGDCAVTSNVPGMRNLIGKEAVLNRACIENVTHNPQLPNDEVPALLDRVRPLHEVVDVDVVIQGCPPSAELIFHAVAELVNGRMPDLEHRARFG
jgi:NAD-reducing hydrogenase small subunit